MPGQDLFTQLPHTVSGDKWQNTGLLRRAGICVPLFSVFSKRSIGIADFSDLKLLIDFAAATGHSILQLLPMNDLGSVFCPYDSISSFAIEPAYLSLEEFCKDRLVAGKIEELRKKFLFPRPHLDYEIKKDKISILKEIFLLAKDTESVFFRNFRHENAYWLKDYALFKVLKEHYHGLAWYEWEKPFREHDYQAIDNFLKERQKEVYFQMWLQWKCFEQFRSGKEYASSKIVFLKGDLPILVSRDSADVWSHTEFFKLELAAGAPPDMYCSKGQRWGMPTYNWEKKQADEYRYIKERLKYAENFYNILRIDHVVGLFRIWSIKYNDPEENQGLNGFFDPADEAKWGQQGRKILEIILKNTKMLLCAEDLGVIPRVCTDTLREFGIPGNDVQRWVKDWNVKHDFLTPQEYRFLAVAMLSTHDTTNWNAWWENEAGTVDEQLFICKCEHRLDYNQVKNKLFNFNLSGNGRLRWLNDIDSVDKLAAVMARRKEEIGDFIDMYLNTYHEKEKLWAQMGLVGPMREKADSQILSAALKITYNSNAVFCIQLITDILGLTDILQGDSYQQRINTPGTVSDKNWSLVMPIPLEELLQHKVCAEIKQMVVGAKRMY
ncbi:MAG: 4-alpha-glucanotransferase [Candidatus Omnitrophica bacterium]|nr:4-alpha-glucanotransferase [Candidatus Omnitrophota bacterium]